MRHVGPDEEAIRAEASAIAFYLVGEVPAAALVERYVAAHARLLPEVPERRDAKLIAFARRHPGSLVWLDAATGLLRRDSKLRKKVLVMAAILETTPRFAPRFLPRHASTPALLMALTGRGMLACLHVVLGIPLLFIAERSRA